MLIICLTTFPPQNLTIKQSHAKWFDARGTQASHQVMNMQPGVLNTYDSKKNVFLLLCRLTVGQNSLIFLFFHIKLFISDESFYLVRFWPQNAGQTTSRRAWEKNPKTDRSLSQISLFSANSFKGTAPQVQCESFWLARRAHTNTLLTQLTHTYTHINNL